jgi:hypothetical protein
MWSSSTLAVLVVVASVAALSNAVAAKTKPSSTALPSVHDFYVYDNVAFFGQTVDDGR